MTAVLVIAGADSSGGAGLTRDVCTLTRLGVEAQCALTAVTAQTDAQLLGVHLIPADTVRAQIAAALAVPRARAVKVGMLGTAASVRAVVDSLPPRAVLPLVVDPVLAASSGAALLDAPGREALRELLLPRATLLTPNIPEAAALLGARVAGSERELLEQGEALLARGAQAVLLKGGHAGGALATDLLLRAGAAPQRWSAPRSAGARRGTGCTLSSAIAAGLAAGLELGAACARAKRFVTEFIEHGG